jgi:hypothetical protein
MLPTPVMGTDSVKGMRFGCRMRVRDADGRRPPLMEPFEVEVYPPGKVIVTWTTPTT